MADLVRTDEQRLIATVNRRKLYYTAFLVLAAVVLFTTFYTLMQPGMTLTPATEGPVVSHPTLSQLACSNPTSSCRPYFEYALPGTTGSQTSGVPRKTVLYVYANAGETICLGSDVTQSHLDANHEYQDYVTGSDIVMIGPSGTVYTFDNDAETGLGFINTTAQEKAGANFTGSNNTAGYIPHEFVARETGLYEVHMHSYSGDRDSNPRGLNIPHFGNTGDPTAIKLSTSNNGPSSSDNWSNTGATVGAYDITVVRNGEVQTGRTYSRLMAYNMGKNTKNKNDPTFYGDFYIVTDDGYIYRNNYELDPYGFIFFCNSRGIVDDVTGHSTYYSLRAKGQSGSDIDMSGLERYSFYNPTSEDSTLDKTFMIFYEEPDPSLEGVCFQKAFAPSKVQNIEFIGSKEGNITYVGNGGYFKFDVRNAVSVSIDINFDEYNAENDTELANITINANVIEGTNYVYWDGNDANGETVPVGWYRNGKMSVTIQARSGEFHFPLFDCECAKGIKFERINRIYDYTDGILTDVTDDYADSRYKVYYNNERMPDDRNSPNKLQIADGVNASNGVDSQGLVMGFGTSGGIGLGDYTILDVWTYAVGGASSALTTDIIIEDIEGYYTVNLNGQVFFDKDESAYYDLNGGDFPLKDVKVDLDYVYCGARWSVERDGEGNITALYPAYASTSDFGEDGNQHEIIEYYYHDFEIHRELGEDGEYHYYAYSYEYTDTKHENAPQPLLDSAGNHVTVDINVYHEYETESGETITKYSVWLPVHKETTTDALGRYCFPGVLVNSNMHDAPANVYSDLVINVHNPDPALYEITTCNAITGDFNTTGNDGNNGCQIIPLSAITDKISAVIATYEDPEDAPHNYFYSVADVGYHYDTYEPPIVIEKNWGSVQNYADIEEIIFHLEGFITDRDGVNHVYYERDVVTDFYSWKKTLTDLPAQAIVNGVYVPLSYRVTSETFKKNSDGNIYRYTYYWDANPAYGQYSYVSDYVQDEEGNWIPVFTPLTNGYQPFETFIYPVKHTHLDDFIYIENWSPDTSSIRVIKIGADDNVTRLKNATFLLRKLNTATDHFEDVFTARGRYTVTTDENGIAEFHGLEDGEVYRLEEVVAPEYFGLADPIIFKVDKTVTGTNNPDVTGTYYGWYETTVFDNLLEAPLSTINKVDQYGDPVANAQFQFYRCNDNWEYSESDVLTSSDNGIVAATLTTDADGKVTPMITFEDGTSRPMYISELKAMLNGGNKVVMKETFIPDGYRGIREAHLRIVGEGLASYIVCDNRYDSGVWTEPVATVYAPETLVIADDRQIANIFSDPKSNGEIDYAEYTDNGRIACKGTLFAVTLKRNRAEPLVEDMEQLTFEDWTPVYGNAIDGYHTVNDMSMSHLERVVEAIKHDGGATEFVSNSNGTMMYAKVESFPGSSERYFTYMYENGLNSVWNETYKYYRDPQYLIAYYYSTAESLDDVTAENTARIASHGFLT